MDINSSSNSCSFGNRSCSRGSETMNVAVQDYCSALFINYDGRISAAAVAWHEMRRAWRGDHSHSPATKRLPISCSSSAAYRDLLSSNEPFDKPVPLAEMVEFLVGIWEED